MLPSTITQNCTMGQQVGILKRLLQHVTFRTDAHATMTHSISSLHVAAGKPLRSLLTFWSVLNLGTGHCQSYIAQATGTHLMFSSAVARALYQGTMSKLDNVNDMQPSKTSPLHTDIALSLLLQSTFAHSSCTTIVT